MMKTVLLWTAAISTAASASVALAAGVGVSATRIGGGNIPIVACDTNGFSVGYTTSRGNLTAITVGAIADPACEGGALSVTITNAAGDGIAMAGPQTVPTDGDALDNSLTVATSPQPAATQVAGYNVSITGP